LTGINTDAILQWNEENARGSVCFMILPLITLTFLSFLGLSCVVAPFLDSTR